MARYFTNFTEEPYGEVDGLSKNWVRVGGPGTRSNQFLNTTPGGRKLSILGGPMPGPSLVGFKPSQNFNYANTIESLVQFSVDTPTQVPGSFGIVNHNYNGTQGLSLAFLPASNVKSLILYDDKNGVTVNFVNYNWSVGTKYWVRYRQENTQHYVKIWQDGSAEPGSWTMTSTYDIGAISGTTYAGVGTYTENGDVHYYKYALATNGDTAIAEYTGAGTYYNGYAYRKKITIDRTKVSFFNGFYHMLLLHTDPDLRSVANGGKVKLNPLVDIRFEDNYGVRRPHETVSYNASTGAIEAWVRLGNDTTSQTLSTTTDTEFYVYFGKDLSAQDIYGIPLGYASGLISFERNWDGNGNSENQGEITPFITSPITSPTGGTVTQPNGLFIGGDESGTLVSGYIMYSVQTIQSRFGISGVFNDHLVLVYWNGSNWQVDLNGAPFVNFTPVSTDFLVGSVSWGNTVGSGRAINYAAPVRAGEESVWTTWSTVWGRDIGEVGNATRAVYHLNEPPAGTWVQNVASSDRFALNMSGSGMNSGDAVAGKIGQALNFNGTNKKLRGKADVIWNTLGFGYMSAWIRPATLTAPALTVFSRRSSSGSADELTMFIIGAQIRLNNGGADSWNTGYNLPAANQWYHIVWIANGTQHKLMVNGVIRATRSSTAPFNGNSGYPRVQLGASITDASTDGNWFSGQIDEFVLSTGNYEDGYHVTAYNNQNSPSTFYSLGVVEQAVVINTIAQTGNARIRRTEATTIAGNARIQRTESTSQLGNARIRRTESISQLGNARIQRTASTSQTGNARLQRIESISQIGNATLESFFFTASIDQTGNARIQRTLTTTQQGNARIERVRSTNQVGSARIERVESTSQTGNATLYRIDRLDQVGNATIEKDKTITQIGNATIIRQDSLQQIGSARIQRTESIIQLGNAAIIRIDQLTQVGNARIERVVSTIIIGNAQITNPTPDKRPQEWEDASTDQPAEWSAEDRAEQMWDNTEDKAETPWQNSQETQEQQWSDGDNKQPAEWRRQFYD